MVQMVSPDGRELVTVPPCGVDSMLALGWVTLDPLSGEQEEQAAATSSSGQPRRGRRIPKPREEKGDA